LELLAFARSHNAVVFECDSCGELRYAGGRIKSLFGLDADRRVIYYGDFFQTLGIFANVGYLVVPLSLCDVFHEIGCLTSAAPPAPLLDAIAEFVEENDYAAHTRIVRSVYAKRLELVKSACRQMLPQAIVSEPFGGLHVVLQFRKGFDEAAVADAAAAEGLPVRCLSHFYRQAQGQKGIVLGFGAVPDQSVPTIVRRLSRLIDEVERAALAPLAEA